MKYLEYDVSSGQILSELVSDVEPEVGSGCGLLEIDEAMKLDTTGYAVRGGVLVKEYETNEERAERLRLRQEQAEHMRQRLKGMMYELCIAILESDEVAVQELRKEYRMLKAQM